MKKLFNSRFGWIYLLIGISHSEFTGFVRQCPVRHDQRKKIYTHQTGEEYAGTHT